MKFIESQHKEQYLSYTYLKLSWLYLLKKQPAEFKKCLHKIQDLTTSTTDEDQQAKYEIIHANDWNQGLIKSRLLFDGGNYSQAIIELLHMKTELPQFTEGQKLEYAYRLARSYDKLGDYEKAIRFYQMVAGSDLQSTFYYPSYAAYFLAQIYIKLQKPHEAKAYFNTCLKKDSPIYKSEIHRKAKDGLLKLN